MALGIAPCFIELAHHLVEGLGQDAQFVAAVNGLTRSEVAGRDRLGAFGKNGERCGQPPRQQESRGNRRE